MSAIFESIKISDEVKRFVDHSFEIINKIYEILEKQGKTQRDLANLMGKKESEISKWMQGTHNFTLKSIAKIESVLGEKLIVSLKQDEILVKEEVLVFYKKYFELKPLEIQFKDFNQHRVQKRVSVQFLGETVSKNNSSTVEVSRENQETYSYLKVA